MVNYRDLLKHKRNSYTLMEILIVVSIIVLIAIVTIILLNPFRQLQKSYDAKRKADLATLKKALEDWYNDKGCYPKPNEICYFPPDPQNVCDTATAKLISQTCNICGNERNSPSFTPYLSKLPCDPEHPRKVYSYEVEADTSKFPLYTCWSRPPSYTDIVNPCPQWYRVYAVLSSSDSDAAILGCAGSACGFSKLSVPTPVLTTYPGGFGFGYGISSDNKSLNHSMEYYCVDYTGRCYNCGESYGQCAELLGCNEVKTCCQIYPTRDSCQRR